MNAAAQPVAVRHFPIIRVFVSSSFSDYRRPICAAEPIEGGVTAENGWQEMQEGIDLM